MSSSAPAAAIATTDLLEEIIQDVIRLKYQWDNFNYLFGDRENVAVLNAAGPGLFGGFQRMMFDDAILRICRLTDPAGNRHQENVSLDRVLHATEWETTDPVKWQVYRAMLDNVELECQPCRAHRDRRVSHKDLAVFANARKLPNPMFKMIDDGQFAIQDFVGRVYSELHAGASFSFGTLINGEHDVEHFMKHLCNRASQKMPNAVMRVLYEHGNTDAELHCPFCGATSWTHYDPNGEPTPRQMLRAHFDECHGVIGCETITVEAVDRASVDQPQRFTIDLTIPTHEMDR